MVDTDSSHVSQSKNDVDDEYHEAGCHIFDNSKYKKINIATDSESKEAFQMILQPIFIEKYT